VTCAYLFCVSKSFVIQLIRIIWYVIEDLERHSPMVAEAVQSEEPVELVRVDIEEWVVAVAGEMAVDIVELVVGIGEIVVESKNRLNSDYF
jgi:hypothetical protein